MDMDFSTNAPIDYNDTDLTYNHMFAILADNDFSNFLFCPLDGANIRKIFTDLNLDYWESVLSPDRYCRLHRSHIVYLHFVVDFKPDPDRHGGYVTLRYGQRYRVSRKYLPDFHRATNFRFASAVQKSNYRKKYRGGGGQKKRHQ